MISGMEADMCLTDGRRYKKMAIRDLGQPRLAKGRWLRIQALLIGLAAPVIAHSDMNLAADSAAGAALLTAVSMR